MLDSIDAHAARRWAVLSLAALGRARAELDATNVFPVPDGDTGTNLYLTVEAACGAVQALPADADAAAVAGAFARGALLGARGNSGIIVAQLLLPIAQVLAERGVMDGPALREAVRRSDEQAWAAVVSPVEGTVLSVSRAVAAAAATAPDHLAAVATAMVDAGRAAVLATRDQLPHLTRAGVVDAGGRGYLLLLEALRDVVQGRTADRRRRPPRPVPTPPAGLPVPPLVPGAAGEHDAGERGYEVMFLLDAGDDAGRPGRLDELRDRLGALGDSLVVVGGEGLFHVHVHVDDAGAAVEAGIAAGRPHQIRITHLAPPAGGRRGPPLRPEVGLVACAAGPGLARVFEEAGAVAVPAVPGRRPGTADLLDAVHRAGTHAVVVLPNDPLTLAAADAVAGVAREHGVRVLVVPTRAQVQGLAAAAVHDPGRGLEEDVVAMSAAAGAARDGAVTIAAREALTTAGRCRPGDALGVVQGDFAVVGDDPVGVAVEVLERLLSGGGELVTLVTGRDAEPALVHAVRRHLHQRHRGVEVSVLDGGQPRYLLLVGVE